MAGIRQHILPRFLLKGFASRTGKETYTWVYRKGNPPFESNIINVGVEKRFYGASGELSADEEITDFENRCGPTVDKLRGVNGRIGIDDPTIFEIIAHICVRTKHLRDSLRNSTDFLVDKINEYLSNENNVRRIMINNEKLVKRVATEIRKNILFRQLDQAKLESFIKQSIPTFLNEQHREIAGMLQLLTSSVKGMIPRVLTESHIKVLAESPAPLPRVESYRTFNWFVVIPDRSSNLGDFGVLFETTGQRRFKAFNDKDDEINNIYLPISKDRIIVGTRSSSPPTIDHDINEPIAKCSGEYFVSSERSQANDLLHPHIGENSSIITNDEMEEIVFNCLNDRDSYF